MIVGGDVPRREERELSVDVFENRCLTCCLERLL